MKWLFLAALLYPSGEVERYRAVYENLAACETERQRIFLHVLQTDPMIRVESRCVPIVEREQ